MLKAQFITAPDLALIPPRCVFHKELEDPIDEDKDPALKNRHVLFRRKAVISGFKKATLRISADDYYKLYVNGSFIAQGPAPSYPSSYYYNELDITNALREGENVFAVHTYYQGLINRVWVSGDRRHMLWLELWIDGELFLVSDTDWLTSPHTAYSEMGRIGYDTAFLERYDARAPECGFYLPDFDDSSWQHSEIARFADHNLVLQPTKMLDIYDIAPKSLERKGNTVRVDLGYEIAGYPMLTVKAEGGERITIKCSEELNPDGSVRFDMRCGCCYLEEMIASGGVDVLSQYDYKAFRYIEIDLPDGAELISIGARVRHYPFSERATYRTDDPDLKQILTLCRDTLKYGAQETYVDCPHREKGQYLGDLSVSGRAHVAITRDTSLFKKALRNFADSAFICKGIMAVSVSSLMQEIADYSLEIPSQVAWLYSVDGDIEFMRSLLPMLRGLEEYFLGYENSDGLLETVDDKWNLVDWPENLRDGYSFPLTRPRITPGIHNVINARYIGFLESLNEIYSILGIAREDKTKKLKQVFKKKFYSEKLGLFADDETLSHAAVHSNIFPLLYRIAEDDPVLEERMANYIREKKLSSMGVYMAYFALAALVTTGRRDVALELTTSPDAWMNMISEGATATYEAWGKDQKWNTSLFHPWATAPSIIFSDEVRPY